MKKIGGLISIFLLNIYNACFADLVMSGGKHPSPLSVEPDYSEPEPINYILIGILVLVVVICAVIVIKRIIKKKKEKSNDNK